MKGVGGVMVKWAIDSTMFRFYYRIQVIRVVIIAYA